MRFPVSWFPNCKSTFAEGGRVPNNGLGKRIDPVSQLMLTQNYHVVALAYIKHSLGKGRQVIGNTGFVFQSTCSKPLTSSLNRGSRRSISTSMVSLCD